MSLNRWLVLFLSQLSLLEQFLDWLLIGYLFFFQFSCLLFWKSWPPWSHCSGFFFIQLPLILNTTTSLKSLQLSISTFYVGNIVRRFNRSFLGKRSQAAFSSWITFPVWKRKMWMNEYFEWKLGEMKWPSLQGKNY